MRSTEDFTVPIPLQPKIYHIVHLDTLKSLIQEGFLWCDAEVQRRGTIGTTIGMSTIKQRRLTELKLESHPDLLVGDCVPFYFCPRSVMLYKIYCGNDPELTYHGGQEPIVHLEADLYESVAWAECNNRRWAFSLSNAGSGYFEDRCRIDQLNEINWEAVQADNWGGSGIDPAVKEGKQAEFLMENSCPWHLIKQIGVKSRAIYNQVMEILAGSPHRPVIEIKPEWYY